MMLAYNCALLLALLLGLPLWLLRMVLDGKYREGLGERLGRVPARLRAEDGRQTIWVHAVSLGEVMATGRLVKELGERAPQFRVVVSTTTRTGQQLARERVGVERSFYYPLDLPWIVRRYLRELRPVLLVLVESEFWPNMLAGCRKRGIPVAVVNGRVSNRSFPRYLRLRFLWKRILSSLAIVLAQSREDVRRFQAIGAPAQRVLFAGNLKFDVRALETAPVTHALRENLLRGTQVLVCGSTLEGEEEALLRAFLELRKSKPNLVMILAPRHPERFARVAELLQSQSPRSLRLSQWMKQPAKIQPGTVLLLDSIGELASVYSLASVAYLGGSLFPDGVGHNPLEPAQFAVPLVSGMYYPNFRAMIDTLLDGEAIKLATPETLTPVLAMLLSDEKEANALGVRALEIFESQAGATERTIDALLRLLPAAASAESSGPAQP